VSSTTVAELWRMSATELAEAIRSGQASSREVIEANLRRIEEVNPAVNAVTVVLAEQALEAAQAADRAAAGGGELPPLHGVPFTVKGNIDLAGTPTTHGINALAAACRRSMPRPSSGCGPPGRSRSATPTCPTSRSAGTPTASCGDRPSTHGTGPARPARPVAARPRRWPPA